MDVEVVVPEEYMGEVIGDLTARRGQIGGMFERGDARVVAAHVPLAEMFGYATRLRSMTQGRAIYTMQFSRYDGGARSSWPRRSGQEGQRLDAGLGAAGRRPRAVLMRRHSRR